MNGCRVTESKQRWKDGRSLIFFCNVYLLAHMFISYINSFLYFRHHNFSSYLSTALCYVICIQSVTSSISTSIASSVAVMDEEGEASQVRVSETN